MQTKLLEILCCPYCGGDFSLDAGPSLLRRGDEIINGLLHCPCATYAVVDGIPVLLAGYVNESFQQLLTENAEQALYWMLDLDEARQAGFERFLASGEAGTYQECLELFCPGSEGPYFVHRFANPTYLIGQALLRTAGSDRRCFARRAIDLGGGSGHLARALCQIAGGAEVWLAEPNFWKLWLARRFVAPECLPICFDAEAPLPFKRGSFSLAFCSDAFHYIWSKRMFAGEMTRLVGDDGVILVNHAHNALQENYSVGLPLAPQWWRNLFAEQGVRIFKESEVLDSIVEHRAIDLSHDYTDAELAEEQALFLIATRHSDIFRVYAYPGAQFTAGQWRINPLYHVERGERGAVLHLQFPSPSYEDEYRACKRYLPAQLELRAEDLNKLATGVLDDELRALAERYVLLNLPERYL
jgi:uncharacterized protein YbaR (Trm112 family)/SAM-dependent methyltransferase